MKVVTLVSISWMQNRIPIDYELLPYLISQKTASGHEIRSCIFLLETFDILKSDVNAVQAQGGGVSVRSTRCRTWKSEVGSGTGCEGWRW